MLEKIKQLNAIFDTHAHYNDKKFDKNRIEIIKHIKKNGVSNVCNISSSLEECKTSIELANKFDFFICTVGIHPENIYNLPNDWTIKLENFAKQKKVVAIGEIGLDYHYDKFDKNKQIETFENQMNIAAKFNLPVVIHSRDATMDTLNIIKKFPTVRGVIHCFSGSAESALKYIELGYFIGFTGILTFKNAKQVKTVAKIVPIEKVVIETDCPFLAPEPWRGQICNSSMLISVVQELAKIKQIEIEDVVKITQKNGFKLYRIK